nr:MAG TPA: hypothetical protein [Bacteriophage sp.]
MLLYIGMIRIRMRYVLFLIGYISYLKKKMYRLT